MSQKRTPCSSRSSRLRWNTTSLSYCAVTPDRYLRSASGMPELLVRVLDGVGQVLPLVHLPAGRLDVIEDVVEVEVRHLRGEPGRHRLALEVLEGAQAEVPHPLGLVLHLRHLAHDGLVQALLGLEDVVLGVAPPELVPPEVEIRCGHGAPEVGGEGNFPYVDSNNYPGQPKRPPGHDRCAPAVAGSRSMASPPGPPGAPRRLGPRRRPRGPLVLAARARGPRGPGLPGGRERLHRGGAGPAGRPPRRASSRR